MADIADMNSQFEAVKIAMNQDKNGHVLKLSIHPNDTPEDIMRDPVGQRYMVVLVRLNDQNEPVPSQINEAGRKSVALAGTLCSDDNFMSWLVANGWADDMSEASASTWLRGYLGITSRKELKVNSKAREALDGLKEEFVNWLRQGKHL